MSNLANITPGLHDEAHRQAFFAGMRAFWARGGPALCQSLKKDGMPCRLWALRGYKFCPHHVAPSVRSERRRRLLLRPKTAAQAMRGRLREAARMQRIIWKSDRWAPGVTVILGEREDQFIEDMRGLGFLVSAFSPASLDAARWGWIGLEAGRMSRDDWRNRIRLNLAKDRSA